MPSLSWRLYRRLRRLVPRLTLTGMAFACPVGAATLIEDPTGPLPATLSGTGLLTPEGQLAHPSAVLYEPAWQLWSNGSLKERHLVLPKGRAIDTSDAADWKYPVGTLLFKTFAFETQHGLRRIETRLIRGLPAGWEFAVYQWKPDGTDATLRDIASTEPVELPGKGGAAIRHEIPNRLQCRQCHEANGNFIIGPAEYNLSELRAETGETRSQLDALHERGLLTHRSEHPARITEDALGTRAIRGYMQANCAHCHNGRERVDLRYADFLYHTIARESQGFLFPSATRIRPGRPEESLLYVTFARSGGSDPASVPMPLVGVQHADQAMIDAVRAWIASLPESAAEVANRATVPRPPPVRTPDRGEGFVPDRHASSLVNRFVYPLAFERVELDGDHSGTCGFTTLRFLPGSNLFLLGEHEGRFTLYELEGSTARRRGEFRLPDVFANIECGLVSMELDPGFASNRFLYVGYCHGDATRVKIVRMQFDPADPARTPETRADVLQADAPEGKSWHTVGSILFDASRAMWVLLGERGLASAAQETRGFLGAVLRIEPNRDPGGSGYTVPKDNPSSWFSRRPRELMAKGLRNPWTGTFDALGRLWLGEVGEKFEEINLLNPKDGYHNFGWPDYDGVCGRFCGGTVNPVISYTRDGDHRYAREDPGTLPAPGQCVWVGPIYRPRVTDRYAGRLDGVLLFGDFVVGWVRGLVLDSAGKVIDDRVLGNMPGLSSWSIGPDDYLYTCTYAAYTQDTPAVFRVIPGPAPSQ